MTSEEHDLITGLFNRLKTADTQQHDAEADDLIRQSVASQPGTPYQLVQTLLVQEHALMNAQSRIKALERQVAAAAAPQAQPAGHSGGFLAGLFGGSSNPAPANIPPQSLPAAAPVAANPPYPSTVNLPASAGGGFLRGALTTAAGVAGGALLFQGIEDLLGHRSGAFGSGLGGGGFMDTGFGNRPEVVENVNNYYGDDAARGTGNDPNLPDANFDPKDDFPASVDPGNDTPPPMDAVNDDFPASVDPGNDAAPPDDFGSSDDSFADSGGGDFSSDDSSSV
jgi:hypothetical protein